MEYNNISISIIMGIYNCADTLQEALDSLYAQTFQNFEIILCDDASCDATYQIALDNASRNSHIVLLKNEKNLGLNATLNKCLKSARGKYIARMDGDDISVASRLEIEFNFLESHLEYAIVSCNMLHFDENGDFGQSGIMGGEARTQDFPKGTPFCHAPCMIRHEAYEAVNGYSVEERLLRVEDYHLWYKMYLKGYIGYNLPDVLYKMRDDQQAAARRKFKFSFNIAYVKFLIVKDFKLPLFNYIYCLRPIIVALLPKILYNFLHKSKMHSYTSR